MRNLKNLLAGMLSILLLLPAAHAADLPADAAWYVHVDFNQMKGDGPGKGVYLWLQGEVFDEVEEDAGIDLNKELDRLTAYSVANLGPVVLLEGNFSQATKDKIMTIIAAEGDLSPLKASGKTYYHFAGVEDSSEYAYDSDRIEIDIESLEDEAWVSLALDRKILITGSEAQMQGLLANKGRIPGSNGHNGAMLVLTAEKTLLQAGMNTASIEDDGDSGWQSNILRNTEQVAFLVAAVADKLALEAKLITTEPDMAESLASVVRGLISLMAFNDEMDADAKAVLQTARVEAKGNSLSISMAIDSDLVVRTLSD